MPPKRRRKFQGLYYHSSPPKVMPMNGLTSESGRKRRDVDDFSVKLSTIRIWMHEKDIGKLTRILWAGQGNRLRQQASTNPKVKRFLAAVPYVMNSIKDVHQAVIDNSVETLQAKLEPPVPPALVTCRDANGLNLVHKAAGLGHATILEYLISIWPDGVQETDMTGKTPLHWAASAKNNMRCYTLLTQAGCDEEALDYKMKTPSFYRHKPNDIERALLTFVPEAPRVSPDVATDWEALSDDSGDGKKLYIKIPEINGFGRHASEGAGENTTEADLNDGVRGLEDEKVHKGGESESGEIGVSLKAAPPSPPPTTKQEEPKEDADQQDLGQEEEEKEEIPKKEQEKKKVFEKAEENVAQTLIEPSTTSPKDADEGKHENVDHNRKPVEEVERHLRVNGYEEIRKEDRKVEDDYEKLVEDMKIEAIDDESEGDQEENNGKYEKVDVMKDLSKNEEEYAEDEEEAEYIREKVTESEVELINESKRDTHSAKTPPYDDDHINIEDKPEGKAKDVGVIRDVVGVPKTPIDNNTPNEFQSSEKSQLRKDYEYREKSPDVSDENETDKTDEDVNNNTTSKTDEDDEEDMEEEEEEEGEGDGEKESDKEDDKAEKEADEEADKEDKAVYKEDGPKVKTVEEKTHVPSKQNEEFEEFYSNGKDKKEKKVEELTNEMKVGINESDEDEKKQQGVSNEDIRKDLKSERSLDEGLKTGPSSNVVHADSMKKFITDDNEEDDEEENVDDDEVQYGTF